eukprot:TRINITY_DN12310_c0_g1_i1.p1 TRINITY_DN12310_c0_g1~~TRINITY_DN12310_c0_g1_i1.p1  ORF type:complete len:304 (-),score=49.24 TRINITY_DN12310_c0_g1_i1:191-1102(-)
MISITASSDKASLEDGVHDVRSMASTTSNDGHATNIARQLERRLEWIEEDLSVTQRRLRDTLGMEPRPGQDEPICEDLKALAHRLEVELAEERKWRMSLDEQLTQVESLLKNERAARSEAIKRLTNDLETSMKALVERIDTSLKAVGLQQSEKAKQSEEALLALIKRVEAGATFAQNVRQYAAASAPATPLTLAQLQQTHSGRSTPGYPSGTLQGTPLAPRSPARPILRPAAKPAATSRASPVAMRSADSLSQTSPVAIVGANKAGDTVRRIYNQLQEENMRLEQRRKLLSERPGLLPAAPRP